MCNCHSYNWDIGKESEIVMIHPLTGYNVCIDACIAHVIKHLWNNHIWTGGSCCGHNRQIPWVGLWLMPQYDYHSNVYRNWVRSVIAEVDNREWNIT